MKKLGLDILVGVMVELLRVGFDLVELKLWRRDVVPFWREDLIFSNLSQTLETWPPLFRITNSITSAEQSLLLPI